jgi:hypothetical protein
MLPVPAVDPSPAWTEAWDGFELDQMSKGRAANVIRSRRCTIRILARHATAAGLDPTGVTKAWLTRYLIEQGKDRQGSGAGQIRQEIKLFFRWFASEYGLPDPMAGIPRPSGKSRPVIRRAGVDKGSRCRGVHTRTRQ